MKPAETAANAVRLMVAFTQNLVRMCLGHHLRFAISGLLSKLLAMSSQTEFDPKNENRDVFRLSLYIGWFVLVSAFLLTINTWMIYSWALGVAKVFSKLPGIEILSQLLIFIGPMVLLYLEWFAWDVIYSQFHARRLRRGKSRGAEQPKQ